MLIKDEKGEGKLNKIRHLLRMKKTVITRIVIALVLIGFIGASIANVLQQSSQVLPHNPLDEKAANFSEIPLQGGFIDIVHAADDANENKDKEEKESDKQKEKETEKQKQEQAETKKKEQKKQNETTEQHKTNEEEKDEEQQAAPADDVHQKSEAKQKNTVGKPNKNGTAASDSDNPDSDNIELTDDKDDGKTGEVNEYFTTSIVEDDIVTEEDYTFTVTQLTHDYVVKDIRVLVNDDIKQVQHLTTDYTLPVVANIGLVPGKNNITVAVTYGEIAGIDFTVLRQYTVTYDPHQPVIETNIVDQEVSEPIFSFTASATANDVSIPIDIVITNKDQTIEVTKGKKKHHYSTTLSEGKNKIILTATSKGKETTKTYTIRYKKIELNDLSIKTNLTNYHDKSVDNATLPFTASAYYGEEDAPITVTHDEQTIEGANGQYQVQLAEGKNTFYLETKVDSATYAETYVVYYEREQVVEPEPDPDEEDEEDEEEEEEEEEEEDDKGEQPEPNEGAPEITIYDMKNGETIKNSIRTFHIKVKNNAGQSITGSGLGSKISATNNGEQIPRDHTDSHQISFTLQVKEGTNHIIVYAEDKDGNKASKELTFTGELDDDGSPIGTATFSVEATTVGLGYLIPAQQVEIYQGERASVVLDRLLKEHGFTYRKTGRADDRFYLASISRPGLVTNPKIADDLLETLEEYNVLTDPNSYHPDWLGEFDFNGQSGWMYSANGIYANVGFADYYPKDGDVIRIRYTVAYGNDIGLGLNNFHKQW